MHGEFLPVRLLFLQAHRDRETTAHFTAIGMPAQQHCDSFRFRRAAFYLDLGLRSGFEPSDLDRPGRLPHQQGLCEARLGYRDGSPQLGAPGPGLERSCKHCMQAPGKQRGQSGARVTVQQAAKSTQAKVSLRGGVEPEGAAFECDRVCFFVLCKSCDLNDIGSTGSPGRGRTVGIPCVYSWP